jgi:fatty-acyl-CoA synthase
LRACGFAAFNPSLGDVVAEGDRHCVALHGLYGMSEIQALFARRPPELPAVERALAGGVPVAATAEVRVRDPDSGRLLGHGQNGELEIKGPSLMSGYFEDRAATAAATTGDGFFRTGDLGTTSADGSFVFLTRMGDVLRLGGYLVAPAEIEAHLAAHPGVAEAQVVGVDTATGPRAAAFVIPTAGMAVDVDGLQAHCAGGLAKFKVPAAIYPIDAFPVTPSPNGEKIQRGKLRAMAQKQIAGGDPL